MNTNLSGFKAHTGELSPWWQALPIKMNAAFFSGLLGVLVTLGLLVCFFYIAQEAVQQGELRNKVSTGQTEAVMRCNTLQVTQISQACAPDLHVAAR